MVHAIQAISKYCSIALWESTPMPAIGDLQAVAPSEVICMTQSGQMH